MAEYLMVETGEAGGRGGRRFIGDAARLAGEGARVTLLLIEDAVAGAAGERAPELDGLLRNGGSLWVDGFSLDQCGLAVSDLASDAEVVAMADVARRLLSPDVRAVWH